MKKRYDAEMLRFNDEILFPGPIGKFKRFAELFKEKVGLPFIAYGRVEFLSEERLKIYKDMGCVSLGIGIESGNTHIRKKILNRHMSDKLIIDTFRLINRYRIRTTAYNMMAFPEEGRKEIFDTIELNRKADPGMTGIGFVYPFHGTPIRDYCLEQGYINDDDPIVNYQSETIIRNKRISKKEQKGLQKTFVLYTMVPRWLFPAVRICEYENPVSNSIYRKLTRIYRDKMIRMNRTRYDPVPDVRKLSVQEHPPLGDFVIL